MRAWIILAGAALAAPAAAEAQCYMAREGSPYDFAAAPQVLFETSFSGDAVGEFPAGLEFKSGALEVAQWQGRRALKASAPSALVVPFTGALPDRFSIEVGVVNRNTKQVGAETVEIYGGRNPNNGQGATRAVYGPIYWEVSGGGAAASAQFNSDDADVCIGQETAVRLQVDGDRLKFYADERRLASVPNAKFLRTSGIVITLAGRDDAENAVYLTGIRITTGSTAPATETTTAMTRTTATTSATLAAGAPGTVTPPTTTTTASATTMQAPVGTRPATTTSATTTAAPATATTAQAPATMAPDDRVASSLIAPLSAPTGLVAEYLGAGYFTFAWSPVAGAEHYELTVHHPSCPSCRISVDPITDTTYVLDQGRLDYDGQQPTVTVRAFANGGASSSPPSAPLAIAQQRWKGYYRVVVTGFQVNRATLDDPAQIDGKWDEVLVTASSQVYDAVTDQTGPIDRATSRVHGDINANAWKSGPEARVKAGSASTLGGLMSGDAFPGSPPWNAIGTPSATSFPLSVWEGWLAEGRQTVTIIPILWEADRPPGYTAPSLLDIERPIYVSLGLIGRVRLRLQPQADGVTVYGDALIGIPGVGRWGPSWAVALAAKKGKLPSRALLRGPIDPAQLRNRIQAAGSDVDDYLARNGYRAMGFDFSGLQTSATSAYSAYQSALQAALVTLLNNRDRPVGIVSGGITSFTPIMVPIDFEFAEAALSGNGPSGKGPGIIEVRYTDAITSGMGDYTIFLRIERLQ